MQPQYKYQISIAGIAMQLISDQKLLIADKFHSFFSDFGYSDYILRFQEVSQLPQIPEQILYENRDYRIHPSRDGCSVHSFFDFPRDHSPYAVATYDYRRGEILVEYLKKGALCVSEMSNSFAHLNFEELLLRKKRLCFHAACVATSLGGILFSGPSGIGKSTQAELWCSLRGARQINGDRPILSKDGDQWLAWGSPYSGSSRCHVNEHCAVSAIVMLRQGPACSVRRLGSAEAFRKVWSGLTVHSWDTGFVNTACDLAQDLIEAVPVYELTCTPDADAVICLEDMLRRECNV